MNKKLLSIILVLALAFTVAACGKKDTPAANGGAETMELTLHRGYGAPNGERSVARFAVLVNGDKIVDALIDEFQYFPADGGFIAVPNSDAGFGEGAAEGMVLGTKMENAEAYSKMMAEYAGSTVSIDANYKAIVDFVKGKTIDEVEKAIANKSEDGMVDGVTGATLVDTANYLQGIVDVAKSDAFVSKVMASNPDNVMLKQIYGAPHGNKAFGDAVVAMDGDKIAGASIDEFQYFGTNGLVNSDKEFGQGYASNEAQLASKLESNDAYSALMAEKAGSTIDLKSNYNAIEEFAIGKTAKEIQATIDENEAGKPVDAVAGATLVDTVGYLQLFVDAANK